MKSKKSMYARMESNKWFFLPKSTQLLKREMRHVAITESTFKKKNVTLSHERAWFSIEMDFKTSLKCISSHICIQHDFVTEDENVQVELLF